MKVLILAGGLGTRLSEETELKPKPMVEIGGMPILWHIMKIYSFYGFNEFVILLGYKGYSIKEFFANYFLHQSDVTIDLASNSIEIHNSATEPWKVTLLDTGTKTMTGGRIKRAREYVKNQTFMLTYGDGLADIDLKTLYDFHKTHGKLITMTSVQPEGKYGALQTNDNNQVISFTEKPSGDGGWINGGFFVCEPGVIDYIDDDSTVFEKSPLETLTQNSQMFTYRHKGFWRGMDTLRDKNQLESLWLMNEAKWKIW